jgi:hypothetical protein
MQIPRRPIRPCGFITQKGATRPWAGSKYNASRQKAISRLECEAHCGFDQKNECLPCGFSDDRALRSPSSRIETPGNWEVGKISRREDRQQCRGPANSEGHYSRSSEPMRTIRKLLKRVARPEGFEPPTLCLEGRRSFQLSYGRVGRNCLSLRRFYIVPQRTTRAHRSLS